MNDRSFCEVTTTFLLVTEFRICRHQKAICVCKYGCAVVWKDLANFTEIYTVTLTKKTPQFGNVNVTTKHQNLIE